MISTNVSTKKKQENFVVFVVTVVLGYLNTQFLMREEYSLIMYGDKCEEKKLEGFRPEIFENPNYDTFGERVDED